MGTIKRNDAKVLAAAGSTSASSDRVTQINAQLSSAVSPALRGDVPELAEIQGLYRGLAVGLRGSAATLDGGARNLRGLAAMSAMVEKRNLGMLGEISAPKGFRFGQPGRGFASSAGAFVDVLQWTGLLPQKGDQQSVGLWLTGSALTAADAVVRHQTNVTYGTFKPRHFKLWVSRWPVFGRVPHLNRIKLGLNGYLPGAARPGRWETAFRKGFSSQWQTPDAKSKPGRARWLKAGKWVGRSGNVLTAGLSGHDQWKDDANSGLSTEAKVARAGTVAVATTGGAMAGAQAGASVGVMVGSFGGPLGMAAGAFVGGTVGGVIGSHVGQRAGKAIAGHAGRAADAVGDFAGDTKDTVKAAAGATRKAAHEAVGQVGDAAEATKDKAGDVASAAKDRAGDVASAAKDKAADVADATKDKAGDGVKAAGKAAKKVGGWVNPWG